MYKGILEGCILALLRKEMNYGYRVVERLRELGFDEIQEATVYPILNRLEKKGHLAYEKRPSMVGPPRKYYRITGNGECAYRAFIENWNIMQTLVQNVLKEKMV